MWQECNHAEFEQDPLRYQKYEVEMKTYDIREKSN